MNKYKLKPIHSIRILFTETFVCFRRASRITNSSLIVNSNFCSDVPGVSNIHKWNNLYTIIENNPTSLKIMFTFPVEKHIYVFLLLKILYVSICCESLPKQLPTSLVFVVDHSCTFFLHYATSSVCVGLFWLTFFTIKLKINSFS